VLKEKMPGCWQSRFTEEKVWVEGDFLGEGVICVTGTKKDVIREKGGF